MSGARPTLWRYSALGESGLVRGEHQGASPAEVRSALHSAGLRVLDLRPLRVPGAQADDRPTTASAVRRVVEQRLRARRVGVKAELLDGFATMLEAGVPLVEAAEALAGEGVGRSRAEVRSQRVLRDLVADLRAGQSLGNAMRSMPSWFDAAEAAMVDAGQASGELPGVIRTIAERHTRSGELANKLAAALAYPMIVAVVGIGVVVFLSTKTLPELALVLAESGQPVPGLTRLVMAIGRGIVAGTPWLLVGAAMFIVLLGLGGIVLRRAGVGSPRWPTRLTPRVLRRAVVAEFFLGLAELLRTGVPAVEALRVIAPTTGGPLTSGFSKLVSEAADKLESGTTIEDALGDPEWFSPEVQRLIRIGQQSGELDAVLERVGQRYRRSARRLIDRLAALLEPAVVLVLAVGVGVVVMAAILPLVRLQEML